MRILVLTHEFPPVGGGGGQVAHDICRELIKTGTEIVLITSHWGDLPTDEIVDAIRVIRVPAMRSQPYKASFLSMGAYILAGFFKAMLLVKNWKPDVLHAHFAVPAGFLTWLLSKFTKIPYVLTAHLGDVPGGVPEKTEKWFRWIFPFTIPIWEQASVVIAVSEHTKKIALRHYNVPIEVIPNGVDLSTLNPGEINLNPTPTILFVGRLTPQKNPIQIVTALAGLIDIPWRCVIIGDGPLRDELESEIEQHKLEDRFSILGWLTPEQVVDWYRRGDILFMPSISEGFPVVGVQASAMGLAIVASRVGGFVEIVVPGENGYLSEPHNTQLFQAHLRELLQNSGNLLTARKRSRELAARYDLRNIVERYSVIFAAAGNPTEQP